MERLSKTHVRRLGADAGLALIALSAALAQQATPTHKQWPVQSLLEANVKAEWEAFKNKDQKAYSDLLADDFAGVEDDNQGQRTKNIAIAEIDRSVISSYNLFAMKVLPLNPDAALVTYELTMIFPPKAAVRLKRVLVSELWIKRDGQWKERYYQETHVK
jgi:hypothetical protein